MTPERSLFNRVPAWRSKSSALASHSHCWQERSTLTLSIRSRSCASVLNRQASLTARLPIKNTILKASTPLCRLLHSPHGCLQEGLLRSPLTPSDKLFSKKFDQKARPNWLFKPITSLANGNNLREITRHFSKRVAVFSFCNYEQICLILVAVNHQVIIWKPLP